VLVCFGTRGVVGAGNFVFGFAALGPAEEHFACGGDGGLIRDVNFHAGFLSRGLGHHDARERVERAAGEVVVQASLG
jgi:hypothetical protein